MQSWALISPGPVEIAILLAIMLFLAFLFWLIRRPVNKRIDELEAEFDQRLSRLEDEE